MWNLKKHKTFEKTAKQKQSYIYREQTGGFHRGGGGSGEQKVKEITRHKLSVIKSISHGDIIYSIRNMANNIVITLFVWGQIATRHIVVIIS